MLAGLSMPLNYQSLINLPANVWIAAHDALILLDRSEQSMFFKPSLTI